MDWIEILQLRSYRSGDREKAVAAFYDLLPPPAEKGIDSIDLFQNAVLENDLGIFIRWKGEVPQAGKSRLGLQLAAAFSEYGQIYHSAWRYKTRFINKHVSSGDPIQIRMTEEFYED